MSSKQDELNLAQKRFALVNGRVITPEQIMHGNALVIDSGKIIDLIAPDLLSVDFQKVDVEERFISPGLVDIHTHGALHHSFNEPTEESYRAITTTQAAHGVTSILATITTAPLADLVNCLEFSRNWMEEDQLGSRVIGVHLEGPYFSKVQRGAQDPKCLRTPNDGSLNTLLGYKDVLKIVSYAPELPGALDMTARLANLGIVPAAGHSSATDEDVLAAMQVGLRHIIHIWSGQSTMIRKGPWRIPGLLESSLVFEGLTVEMIADNKHLPPVLMKLAYKCLGADRLCVISDAVSGAGLPDGTEFSMGNMTYVVKDGVGMMLDLTGFAGSTSFVNQMVKILMEVICVPLVEAVRMASLTPARVIGIDDNKGSITIGKDADLTIFEKNFTVWKTMIAGKWVYSNKEDVHK